MKFFAKIKEGLWDGFQGRILCRDPIYRRLLQAKVIEYDKENRTYVRDVMGHVFHLHSRDKGISKVLASEGIREKESVDALFRYVTSDMTIFDLGANIGFYVLLEARIVSQGRGKVIAIEPGPENLRLLRLNVKANNYENCVEVYEGAISERTGRVKLRLSEASNCHTIVPATEADSRRKRKKVYYRDVPSYSFFDFLKLSKVEPEELDFLRMDVEAAEYQILPTIYDLLHKKKTFLMFVEFHPSEKERTIHTEVLKNLENMGFRCLTATKEYVVLRRMDGKSRKVVQRKHTPDVSLRQLYCDEFFMQPGGCETYLGKGM